MCERGDILESRDSQGRQVLMCSECGNVFTIIHHCAEHLVVGVGDAVVVMGDLDSECSGVIDEVPEVQAERTRVERRAAAEWN